MRNLLEEAELAEQVGLDVFGVGEHHRPDFAVSSPAVALAAIAARTERIRLTSAVTVLSSDDPVRVFQDFATIDLLSGGRAEIMVGRGSFIESFPLFGYDLDDYDELFAEKLELLLALRDSERVTWSGRHRPGLVDAGVYPRPVQDPLPIWVAVGGSPQSIVRAAGLGLPLALAIIGGEPERFAPLVQLYRDSAGQAGHDPARLPVSINSHTYVADAPDQATREFFPAYAGMMTRIGRERGWSPMTREQFDVPALAARRAGGGQPGGGGGEDPLPARAVRPRPLPRPDQRRRPAARAGDAGDRAARHRGGAGGARGARPPHGRAGCLVGRLGLEPRSHGLTCRTGSHRPPAMLAGVAVWTISSPSARR